MSPADLPSYDRVSRAVSKSFLHSSFGHVIACTPNPTLPKVDSFKYSWFQIEYVFGSVIVVWRPQYGQVWFIALEVKFLLSRKLYKPIRDFVEVVVEDFAALRVVDIASARIFFVDIVAGIVFP